MTRATTESAESTHGRADTAETGHRPVDVSVVIVSYQCRADLERCLSAVLLDAQDLNLELFVVDNASTDLTVQMVTEKFPSAVLIANERNVGFAAANNRALARYSGRYAFLLNPDAFLMPGALGELIAFMEMHPEAGGVGPKLVNRDGSLQYSIRRFPSLRNAAFETFFLHRAFPRFTSRFGEVVVDERAYASAHPVEWLSGAAMFVRREVIQEVGVLDESFFLFAEEVDWFKRMQDADIEVWYTPGAVAIHRDSDGGVNPELIGQSAYARDQYWRKHASPARALIARGLLVAYMSLRFVLWRLVGLRGTEYARSQYRAYHRGLRDFFAGRSLLRESGE